jgi:hypothetical protein
VRCDECKTEPLTPGHFCECCGRKLSLQERRVLEERPVPEERPVIENSWVEPARPPQPVASTDPRAGMQLTPELYVEPVTTSEPAPVEIDPALEERFAKFASGAISSADDEPVRNTDALLSAAQDSSPVVVQAETAIEAGADAAAVPHALVDSFLEAHFAGQPPAGISHVTPVPVADSPFAQVQARLRAHTTSTAVGVMDLPPVDVPATHDDADVRGSRCESCGGAADDGDLCATCKNAFHSLFDNSARAQSEPLAASPDVEATVILPTSVALPAQPSPVADTSVISVPAAVAPAVVAAPVAAAAPAAAAPSTAAPVVERLPEPPKIRIRAEQPAAPVAAQAVAEPGVEHQAAVADVKPARPARPKAAAGPSSKSSAPAQPPVMPNVPAAGRSRIGTLGAAAAVVVVLAAIGFPLSRLWLGGHESSPVIREEPSAPAAATPAPTPAVSPAVIDPAPAAVASAAAAPPAPVALAPAKPVPPAAARSAAAKAPPKNARPSVPVKPVAIATAPIPVVAAVPEVVVAAPVVVPEVKPEPPAAALGPFYEVRDVNQPPAVATRVEPRIPEELRASAASEIVIARVLVSQSGRAQTVTLLRRSKAGAALDDAIVVAVKQWTFAPARRRGEAVSCWYNLGVPVGR